MVRFVVILLFLNWGKSIDKTPKLWEMSPQEFFVQQRVKEPIDCNQPDEYLLSIAVFHATNQLREAYGLFEFKPNRALHFMGENHIENMRTYDFFAHENPYDVHTTIKDRSVYAGAQFNLLAENLALLPAFNTKAKRYHYKQYGNAFRFYDLKGKRLQPHTYESFAKLVVAEWYKSKGHRKNMLNQQLTHIGISVYVERFDYEDQNIPVIYAVQEFGGY